MRALKGKTKVNHGFSTLDTKMLDILKPKVTRGVTKFTMRSGHTPVAYAVNCTFDHKKQHLAVDRPEELAFVGCITEVSGPSDFSTNALMANAPCLQRRGAEGEKSPLMGHILRFALEHGRLPYVNHFHTSFFDGNPKDMVYKDMAGKSLFKHPAVWKGRTLYSNKYQGLDTTPLEVLRHDELMTSPEVLKALRNTDYGKRVRQVMEFKFWKLLFISKPDQGLLNAMAKGIRMDRILDRFMVNSRHFHCTKQLKMFLTAFADAGIPQERILAELTSRQLSM